METRDRMRQTRRRSCRSRSQPLQVLSSSACFQHSGEKIGRKMRLTYVLIASWDDCQAQDESRRKYGTNYSRHTFLVPTNENPCHVLRACLLRPVWAPYAVSPWPQFMAPALVYPCPKKPQCPMDRCPLIINLKIQNFNLLSPIYRHA